MFKFRIVVPGVDPPIGPGPPGERNSMQASFPSSYYMVSQLSLIVSVIVTAAYAKKLPLPDKRISAALFCNLVFYVVNLIFCKLVTDKCKVCLV